MSSVLIEGSCVPSAPPPQFMIELDSNVLAAIINNTGVASRFIFSFAMMALFLLSGFCCGLDAGQHDPSQAPV